MYRAAFAASLCLLTSLPEPSHGQAQGSGARQAVLQSLTDSRWMRSTGSERGRREGRLLDRSQTQMGQEASGSPWFVQIEAGAAEIHEEEERGAAGAVRLGRYLDRDGIFAAILSAGGAATDAAYGTLEVGLQLQLPGRPRITPTIGGRIGLLVEEGFTGDVVEGTAGLAFRIADEQWIRLSVQVARHSDARGPHALLIGYQAPL